MLKNVHVSAALEKRRRELISATKLTTDELAQNLARSVRFDPRRLYNADGTLKGLHELDDETAMCLTGIEVTTTTDAAGAKTITRTFRWENKATARDQAMRMLGLFARDNRQFGSPLDGLSRELVQAIVERLTVLNAGFENRCGRDFRPLHPLSSARSTELRELESHDIR